MGENVFLQNNIRPNIVLSMFFMMCTLMHSYSQVICEAGRKTLFNSMINQCNNNEWVLVFEDDFNGNLFDSSTWQLRPCGEGSLYGSGGKTQEYNSLDNVIVGDGFIRIVALQDTIIRKAISYKPDYEILSDGLPNLREYYFTSSNIWSKKEFEYGKIEARIRIPRGKGFWPAFWLYGGDIRWNELDIFEFWNENIAGTFAPNLLSKVINMTAHYDYDNDGQTNMCHTKYTGVDYSNGFHIYSLEWEPNRIAWYVDGNCLREDFRYYNMSGQPAGCYLYENTVYIPNAIFPVNPMNIIYNLSIQNGIDNQPNDPSVFPAYMDIDWVKYYKRGSSQDLVITDSTIIPLSTVLFNSIIGNTISFYCPYTIHQGNQMSAVANTEIMLSSGFCIEEGGTFIARIDNLNSKNTEKSEELKTYIIDEVESSLPPLDVDIYPTISQGVLNVEFTSHSLFSEYHLVLFDILGNQVFSKILQGDNIYRINIPNCSKGIYIVQISDNHGVVLKTNKIFFSK